MTKFPKSTERSQDKPAVLCPADRVLNLYNNATGEEAKRISKKVRTWFTTESLAKGWDSVGFIPEVESQHGAGCLMYKNFGNSSGTTLVKEIGGTAD